MTLQYLPPELIRFISIYLSHAAGQNALRIAYRLFNGLLEIPRGFERFSRFANLSVFPYPGCSLLVALEAVRQDGHVLQTLLHFRNMRQVVLQAVAQNGLALQFASADLKADREIVRQAVTENGLALYDASGALKQCEDLVKIAVAQNSYAIFYARIVTKEIAMLALQGDDVSMFLPPIISVLPDELRGDPDIKKLALSSDGLSLEYYDNPTRWDVFLAVKENGMALKFAGNFQNDPVIVMAAVFTNGDSLQYAASKFKKNKHIVLIAVKNDAYAIKHADRKFLSDKDVALAAVRQNGLALYWIKNQSPEIVKAAVQNTREALCYVKDKTLLN